MTQSLGDSQSISNLQFVRIEWHGNDDMRLALININPMYDSLMSAFLLSSEQLLVFVLCGFHGCEWQALDKGGMLGRYYGQHRTHFHPKRFLDHLPMG